jgi:hypothetical protein
VSSKEPHRITQMGDFSFAAGQCKLPTDGTRTRDLL